MGEAASPNLKDGLADELDGVRHTLEHLAMQLCLDPVVFGRHAGPLQHFDHLAQVIGEVASVLRHRETAPDAIAAVRLDTLRARLSGASW